jgi:large subunit ribosomal protein LP1
MSAELAVVYAALILEDDGISITADKIRKLLEAAKVNVEGYWVDLFTEYFKNNAISSLLKGTALGGAAPAAAGAVGATSDAPAAEEKKEEKKEEEAALDIAGGFDDLFG